MKTNTKQPESAGQAKAGTPETKLVRLEFSHPTACSVCIAGTFNDWHPGVTEMMALGDGRWAKELALPPGTYEYRLVADGEWMSNPAATESMRTRSGGRTPSFGWPPTQRWPVDGRGARESVAAMRSQETKSAN